MPPKQKGFQRRTFTVFFQAEFGKRRRALQGGDTNGDGKSTLTYSSITYKSGWNSTKLTEKTGVYRRTVLFPNVNKLGFNYPITAIDSVAKTITVKGNATTYLSPPTTFAVLYGQYIKDIINVSGTNKTVKFFDKTGTNSFADGDGTYNGVCEVCHTLTAYHRNNATGDHSHYAGTNCAICHSHVEGFKGVGCDVCHAFPPPPLASNPGTTGSATAGAHDFQIVMLAYNLWRYLKRYAEPAECPDKIVATIHVSRLKLLFIAAKIVNHSNRVWVKYSRHLRVRKILDTLYQRIDLVRKTPSVWASPLTWGNQRHPSMHNIFCTG